MPSSTGATLVTSGTNTNSGVAWTSPGNITLDDGSNAVVATTAGQNSQQLTGTGLGFSVPTNATIVGIELTVHGMVSTSQQQFVRLTKDGTNIAGSNKTATQGTTANTVTYGSSADLWGTTWAPSDVNASTFGGQFLTQ
jgi:hypothetical protein